MPRYRPGTIPAVGLVIVVLGCPTAYLFQLSLEAWRSPELELWMKILTHLYVFMMTALIALVVAIYLRRGRISQ